MKASHYIKEVKKSQPFKDFMKEDAGAYLCSLFFVRDFTGNHNETQVDFYSPKKKAMVSFRVGRGVERIPINKKTETLMHKKFIPKTLNDNVKMDVDVLKPTLTDEMKNRDMTYEIEKILVFLNIVDERAVWNCTAFLKGLGLLQAHVEDATNSVLFMEKKSLFDLINFAGAQPGAGGMAMPKVSQELSIATEPEMMAEEPAAKEQPQAKAEKEGKQETKPVVKPEGKGKAARAKAGNQGKGIQV